jgi:hypothetical protein
VLAWIVQLGYTADAVGTLPPDPEPTGQTPAGSSRRRKRYYVEIDGQQFPVASPAEAEQVLQHARALAERAAEQTAERVVEKRTASAKVAPVTLAPPVITASPELHLDLTDIRRQLQRVYQGMAMAAEMRLLLAKQAEQDEEEAIFLLM